MSGKLRYITEWADSADGGGNCLPADEVKFTLKVKDIQALLPEMIANLQSFLYTNSKVLSNGKAIVTASLAPMETVMQAVDSLMLQQQRNNEALIDKLASDIPADADQARNAYLALLKEVEALKTALSALSWQQGDAKLLKKKTDELAALWQNNTLAWLTKDTSGVIQGYTASQNDKEVLEVDFDVRRRRANRWINETTANRPRFDREWLKVDIGFLSKSERYRLLPYRWDWWNQEWWTEREMQSVWFRDRVNKEVGGFIGRETRAIVENGRVTFPMDKDDDGYRDMIVKNMPADWKKEDLRVALMLEQIPRTDWTNPVRSLQYSARQRWIHCALLDIWKGEAAALTLGKGLVELHNCVSAAFRLLYAATSEIDDLGSVFFEPLNGLIEEVTAVLHDIFGNFTAGSMPEANAEVKVLHEKMEKIRALNSALAVRKRKGLRPAYEGTNFHTSPDYVTGWCPPGNNADWIYGICSLGLIAQDKRCGTQMTRNKDGTPYFAAAPPELVGVGTGLRWLQFPEHILPRIRFGVTTYRVDPVEELPVLIPAGGTSKLGHVEWDISFNSGCFDKEPQVCAWLNMFYVTQEPLVSISVQAKNITKQGFTLVVDVNADENDKNDLNLGCGWLAFDRNDPDIWASQVEFKDSTYATTPEDVGGGGWDGGRAGVSILRSLDDANTSQNDAFVEGKWVRNQIERAHRGQILDFPPGKYKARPMMMLALDSMRFETSLPDGRKEPVRWVAETPFLTRDKVVVNGGTWDGSFMLGSSCWIITCS